MEQRQEDRTLLWEGEPVLVYTPPDLAPPPGAPRRALAWRARLEAAWRRRWEGPLYRRACAALAAARHSSRALQYGGYRNVLLTNRQIIFERAVEGERVLVAVNADSAPFTAHFDAQAGRATDLITGAPHDFGGGSELPPRSVRFWRTE